MKLFSDLIHQACRIGLKLSCRIRSPKYDCYPRWMQIGQINRSIVKRDIVYSVAAINLVFHFPGNRVKNAVSSDDGPEMKKKDVVPYFLI